MSVREVIESAVWKFEEYIIIEEGEHEKVAILRDININFLCTLYENSKILCNKTRE
jgi:hypothetical protein